MQVYLVGGAVRDQLLGRPVGERDWVVVGATPQELEQRGYRAVGRDFPVYLHPETHEEYALARLERKVAPGYRGFALHSSPEVTLEQDLERRDLTINAMARASDGELIDPFGGQRDIAARQLRHVSAAFVEDPVRVVRVARFAARFHSLGFTVAPETLALMRRMVDNGEIRALVPERLWRELDRALAEPNPEAFFDCLQACAALPVLMPELSWNAAARRALMAAVALSAPASVRFAALLAQHPVDAIDALCERLRVPSEYRDLTVLAAALARRLLAAMETPTAEQLVALLEAADAWRRPERFHKLLLVARALSQPTHTHLELWSDALDATAAVTLPREQLATLKGQAIAAALRVARIEALGALLRARVAGPDS
jgi:tRNA nucleotidyltransferase (CCA-adding enzyme)